MPTSPVILCGLGRVGWRVLEILRAANRAVTIIDNQVNPADPRLAEVRVFKGDFRDRALLEEAGVRSASGVLILASDDLVNISAALTVRQLNRDVRIVVRMFNQNLLDRLGQAVTKTAALSVSALTAPLLALTALTGEVLGAFSAGDSRRQLADLTISPGSTLIGKTIGDIAGQYHVMPISICAGGESQKLFHEITPDHRLQAGDELVLCGEPQQLVRLLPLGQAQDWESLLPGVKWAGRIRRWGRVLVRTLMEVDLALKISGAVLAMVIIASTLIYWGFGLSSSLPDGLYRTISVMATGADMKADNYVGWQKVFVSVLRVLGAILTAAFTAIFTNYLIRARLGGALEIRRIPDAGHVIVCGLGNVGFRVVEELLQHGERVVVIERSQDNAFIGTCRRLGAAVIVGDAVVLEVLRQARAGTARALVACTSNDLANLEIALLARELNPKQRLVLRMSDPQLAETARATANLRLALSLPALAAPAYVAALYGDRVMTLFRLGTQMLAAVELTVQAEDPCLKDQSIRAISIDYQIAPVALQRNDGSTKMDPMTRLSAGDRLTVIGVLSILERLFRREPAPAEWRIEITGFAPIARPQVVLWLRTENHIAAEEAETAIAQLPAQLGGRKTRGQAEEWLAVLERERVEAKLLHL